MKAVISGLLFSLPIWRFAQKSPIKFSDISLEEGNMRAYDRGCSAEAVMLVDYGEADLTVFSDMPKLKFERHVRIKVLKKEGLRWADATIKLYDEGRESENVAGLKTSSYILENGEIVDTRML
jgi:hypothetical protein